MLAPSKIRWFNWLRVIVLFFLMSTSTGAKTTGCGFSGCSFSGCSGCDGCSACGIPGCPGCSGFECGPITCTEVTDDDDDDLNGDPVIGSFTASPERIHLGQTSTISVQAEDPDGDELSYAFSVDSGGGSLAISGTPEAIFTAGPAYGSTVISVTVSDGLGGTDTAQLSVMVTPWDLLGDDTPDSLRHGALSLALDPQDGTPYLAFEHDSGTETAVSVAKLIGQSWEFLGPSGPVEAGLFPPALSVANGTPYLATISPTGQAWVHAYRAEGDSWAVLGSGPLAADSAFISITHAQGIPHVAFDGASAALVLRYSGSGASGWEPVGSPGFIGSPASLHDLRADGSTLYLAFRDEGAQQRLGVLRYEGASWTPVCGRWASPGVVQSLSLGVEPGAVVVAYADDTSGGQLAVRICEAGASAWTSGGTIGVGTVDYVSLVLDHDAWFVAFQDMGNDAGATVLERAGTGQPWAMVGNANLSGGRAEFTRLARHGSTLYVAWRDARGYARLARMGE